MKFWKSNERVKDRVWVSSNGFVCCQFAASGRSGQFSSFDPKNDLTLAAVEGESYSSLVLERLDGIGGTAKLILEDFANRGSAEQARNTVVETVQTSFVRARRMRRFFWTGLLVIAFVALLSMAGGNVQPPPFAGNPALSEFYKQGALGDKEMSALYGASSFKKGADMPAGLPALPLADGSRPPEQVVNGAKLMNSQMQLDVSKVDRLNSIRFGSGKPAIYVFSDPLCPACQQLESLLEGTKQPYAVIPVAIKGEESAVKIARIMCAKDPGKAWRDEVAGQAVPLDVTDKAALGVCAKKIIANMNAFRDSGITTVPALVNAHSGKVIFANSDAEVFAALKK